MHLSGEYTVTADGLLMPENQLHNSPPIWRLHLNSFTYHSYIFSAFKEQETTTIQCWGLWQGTDNDWWQKIILTIRTASLVQQHFATNNNNNSAHFDFGFHCSKKEKYSPSNSTMLLTSPICIKWTFSSTSISNSGSLGRSYNEICSIMGLNVCSNTWRELAEASKSNVPWKTVHLWFWVDYWQSFLLLGPLTLQLFSWYPRYPWKSQMITESLSIEVN